MILLVHNIVDAATDFYYHHAFADTCDADNNDAFDAGADDEKTCLRG